MLRSMYRKTGTDYNRNEDICLQVRMIPLEDKVWPHRMHILEGWRKLTMNRVKG